jgi:hypothetical protein
VVMVRHQAYLKLETQTLKAALRNPVLIDGRRLYDGSALQASGWIYRAVGQAPDKAITG